MIDAYQAANDPDHQLSAATRLLQVDPNNPKALFYSVALKKAACQKGLDPATGDEKDVQSCDDSAALAEKALTAPKPDSMDDAQWKGFTGVAYPSYHSAIAFDDEFAKKDLKGAISEFNKELMLYPPDQCSKAGPCLIDTLQLAQAYAKPGDARDQVKAVWFYARAWDFAPPSFKAQIETPLEYWYNRYHGTLDGAAANKSQVDAIKTQAQATLFPPSSFTIEPAPTPDKLAHAALVGGDPMKLNLEDKEFILANGNKDDAAKLWDLLKDQLTPVPGVVISDPVNAIAISLIKVGEVKPIDYSVALAKPMACTDAPAETATTKEKLDFIQANAAPSDASKIADLTALEPSKIRKLTVDLGSSQLKVAVTEDAKGTKTPDFIVNMKEPVGCKVCLRQASSSRHYPTRMSSMLPTTRTRSNRRPTPPLLLPRRSCFAMASFRPRRRQRPHLFAADRPPAAVAECNRQFTPGTIMGSSLRRAALFLCPRRKPVQPPAPCNGYSPSMMR